MDWLHGRNMKITLNVHPADGVRAYEEAYERVAKRMGINPDSQEPVQFDVTDRHFLEKNCIIPWRMKVWIFGGWTGSRELSQRFRD